MWGHLHDVAHARRAPADTMRVREARRDAAQLRGDAVHRGDKGGHGAVVLVAGVAASPAAVASRTERLACVAADGPGCTPAASRTERLGVAAAAASPTELLGGGGGGDQGSAEVLGERDRRVAAAREQQRVERVGGYFLMVKRRDPYMNTSSLTTPREQQRVEQVADGQRVALLGAHVRHGSAVTFEW